MNLDQVAKEISRRLTSIFVPEGNTRTPWSGEAKEFSENPFWKDFVLFHEFFHGETGAGLGASHQTGWTALIARLIADRAKDRKVFPGIR